MTDINPASRAEDDEWATLAVHPLDTQDSETMMGGRRSLPPEPARAECPLELLDHPRYLVLGSLGKGGMGAVFKAQHRVMKRFVALKVIAEHLVSDPSIIGRFRREIEVAARLSHPNIVTAYDAEQVGSCHFLVMEYVEGIDLAKYMKKKGALPLNHACHFIRQAALGLQHAHECGMVHRDIKPANLMLTTTGVVKIMDFGLARLAREGASWGGLTAQNIMMGTADYMAPEQGDDAQKADVRADIYSLGCTLFHLLAGRPPFAGSSMMQTLLAHTTTAPPLEDLPAGTPEIVRTVLAKMLQKDPARRYQTPDEVAKALRLVRKPPALVELPSEPKRKNPPPICVADTHIEAPVEVKPSDRPSKAPSDDVGTSEKKRHHSVGQSRMRRPKRKKHSYRWLWALAVMLTVVGGVAGLVALGVSKFHDPKAAKTVAGSEGDVVVRCRDARLQVAIRRDGKTIKTVQPDSTLTLPTGEYDFEVVDGAPELRGFKRRLTLSQGGLLVVEVLREGMFTSKDTNRPIPPPPRPKDK